MDTVANLDQILASFDELWAPRVVAEVNEWAVKIARVRGDFVWHAHHDTDEVFLVLGGVLDIDLRPEGGLETVHLEHHDAYVVPRGMEHRPHSDEGAVILLLEPSDTLSTGDFTGDVPDHITSTRGLAAEA